MLNDRGDANTVDMPTVQNVLRRILVSVPSCWLHGAIFASMISVGFVNIPVHKGSGPRSHGHACDPRRTWSISDHDAWRLGASTKMMYAGVE
jgi:hypothetical protein